MGTADGRHLPVRVLIVEDHELLAATLAIALRQRGLEVHTAAGPTPADIVATARRLEPALVLLDLDLGPGVGSGLDLVAPLADGGPRVVMMTGVTDHARLGACLEAGAVGIISKTSGFEELADAVHRAAAGADLLAPGQRQALLDELRSRRAAERDRQGPLASLSPREQAVLARLVAGDSAETIANLAYVSLATVRSQIRSILLKLGVRSQLAAVARAREAGWPREP